MKVMDKGVCLFNGSHKVCHLFSKNDLLVWKQVWDMDTEPPTLLHTKSDDEIYIEWEASEINQFAQDQIFKFYPLWKQQNISLEGNEAKIAKMTTFINAVRAWSNSENPDPWDGTLEEITPTE